MRHNPNNENVEWDEENPDNLRTPRDHSFWEELGRDAVNDPVLNRSHVYEDVAAGGRDGRRISGTEVHNIEGFDENITVSRTILEFDDLGT
ncbi:MAG: hypothetical protein C4537_07490, partial [Acholeplasma sp.]